MTADLVAFVLARAAEREALAQAAQLADGPWVCGTSADHLVDTVVYRPSAWTGHIEHACNTEYAGAEAVHVAEFIAHHDPARVLREVAAVRAIVAEVMGWTHRYVDEDPWLSCGLAVDPTGSDAEPGSGCCRDDDIGRCTCGLAERQMRILRPLASVESDHPDYRKEWTL